MGKKFGEPSFWKELWDQLIEEGFADASIDEKDMIVIRTAKALSGSSHGSDFLLAVMQVALSNAPVSIRDLEALARLDALELFEVNERNLEILESGRAQFREYRAASESVGHFGRFQDNLEQEAYLSLLNGSPELAQATLNLYALIEKNRRRISRSAVPLRLRHDRLGRSAARIMLTWKMAEEFPPIEVIDRAEFIWLAKLILNELHLSDNDRQLIESSLD